MKKEFKEKVKEEKLRREEETKNKERLELEKKELEEKLHRMEKEEKERREEEERNRREEETRYVLITSLDGTSVTFSPSNDGIKREGNTIIHDGSDSYRNCFFGGVMTTV